MKTPTFSGNEYVDSVAFNTAAGLVSGDIAVLNSATMLPGLSRNDVISFAATGLTMGLHLPAPFGINFGTGVFAQAHGVVTGQDTSTYAVSLSGVVPASGTATIYMLASQYSIQQNPYGIPGPPPGHPSYVPTFVPYTAYATTTDTLSITPSTTPPNNVTTFELCRTVLGAGATGIGAIDTTHQWLTAPVAQQNTASVLVSKALVVGDAGTIQRLDNPVLTITLPPVGASVGRKFSVVQRAIGTSIVQVQDGVIYGAWGAPGTAFAALSVSTGQLVSFISDGQNWQIEALSGDETAAAGQVFWFAAPNVPSANYYVCDGSLKSRTADAALFNAIGTLFGSGDGLTTFGLPNLLGEFLRGWNSTGTGPDPNRVFGSTQVDVIKGHVHPFSATAPISGTGTGAITGTAAGSVTVTGVANGAVNVTGTGTGTSTFTGSGSGVANAYEGDGRGTGGGGLYTFTNTGSPGPIPTFVSVTGSGTVTTAVSAAGTNVLPVTGVGVASLPVTGSATVPFTSSVTISGTTDIAGLGIETRPTNVALLPCICRGQGSNASGGSQSTYLDLRNFTTLDGVTDNTVAVQTWLNLLASTGCIGTWIGLIRTTAPVYFPSLPVTGDNAAITGSVRIDACGRTASLWWGDVGPGQFVLDDRQIVDNAFGVRSGCLLRGFRMFGSYGPGYSQASGAIRLANWREGIVEDIQVDSFRYGVALTLYGARTGDMQYVHVRNSQFGWWHLNNQLVAPAGRSPARIGLDDFWWCDYGILLYGNADSQGKANENRIDNNDFYNCANSAICVSGYSVHGNPGIPDPSQPGVLGGALYNTTKTNSIQAQQCRLLWNGIVGSGSTANTVVLGDATTVYVTGLQTSGYFVDPTGLEPIYASCGAGGACSGQYGVITGYTYASGSGIATISGQWFGGPPQPGDALTIGYRPIGVMIDSAGAFGDLFLKTEQVTEPLVIKAVTAMLKPPPAGGITTGNISLLPLLISNSGGNGIVVELSQGPFAVQSVSGMVLTMTSGMSPLGGWYARNNGQSALIISGTASGQFIRVAAWSGASGYQLTPTASSWAVTSFDVSGNPNGVPPDNTSILQMYPGAQPMLLSPQVRKNVLDYDTTNNGNSNQVLDSIAVVSRYLTTFNNSNEPVGVPNPGQPVGLLRQGFNGTGHIISAGDVLRAVAGTATFGDTSGTANAGCVVVFGQAGTETFGINEPFSYGLPGCVLSITMASGASGTPGTSLVSASGNIATNAVNPTQEAFIGTIEQSPTFSVTANKTMALVRIR